MKERTNRRYSCLAYYIGRTLADAPFRIIFPIIYSVIIYKLTGQTDEFYRLFIFCLINVAFAFMAQSVGMLFASVFINSISAAAVNGCVSLTPFMLLGGFLVNVDAMPPWAQSLSTVSYFRVCFFSSFLFLLSTICTNILPLFPLDILYHLHYSYSLLLLLLLLLFTDQLMLLSFSLPLSIFSTCLRHPCQQCME